MADLGPPYLRLRRIEDPKWQPLVSSPAGPSPKSSSSSSGGESSDASSCTSSDYDNLFVPIPNPVKRRRVKVREQPLVSRPAGPSPKRSSSGGESSDSSAYTSSDYDNLFIPNPAKRRRVKVREQPRKSAKKDDKDNKLKIFVDSDSSDENSVITVIRRKPSATKQPSSTPNPTNDESVQDIPPIFFPRFWLKLKERDGEIAAILQELEESGLPAAPYPDDSDEECDIYY